MRGRHPATWWYEQRQAPDWARLRELFALYPPAPGEAYQAVTARMSPADREEALALAERVAPLADGQRREAVARLAASR